uniref:Hydrolase n=1 Tax=Gongylonema pulchrum TaxID=637853 RepID=A0A183EFU3_9BILA
LFEGLCDWNAVMASKTVRDFDTAFTAPMFGYSSCAEYYHAAALYWKVHNIPIPTVCLNAADDCFSPIESIPFSDIEKSRNVAVAVTRHGGHIAFMNKANPLANGLVEDFIVQCTGLMLS